MKKRKQILVGKAQYYRKKRIQTGVDDLSTHEEKEMSEVDQIESKHRQQKLYPIRERQSSEDEGEEKFGEDPDQQSRFVLDLIQKNVYCNKIQKLNEKNSFQVPLIDLRNLRAFQLTEEGEAWKEISASLDANSRVYGFRVDQVHHSTFKILEGLNRNKTKHKEDQKEEDKVEAQLKKIANTNGESTLEKIPANIELSKFEIDFKDDPLFERNTNLFDDGSAKGLLSYNLSITESLMLEFETEEFKVTNIIGDVNIDKYKGWLKKLHKAKLCPELTELRGEMYEKGLFREKPSFEKQMKDNIVDFDWSNDGAIFQNKMDHQFTQEDQFSVNQLDYIPMQNPLKDINEERQPPKPSYLFNLQYFDSVTADIGSGRVFENEKDKVSWLKLNTKLYQRTYLIKTFDYQERPRNKKGHDLPFSFDAEDDEDIDRESILQPKERQEYCLTKDPLKQQNLLPIEYQIDRNKQQLINLSFYSPFQLPSVSKFSQKKQYEQIYEHNEVDEVYEVNEVNEINEEINIDDRTGGDLWGGDESKSFISTSSMKGNPLKANIPIKVMKAKVWLGIENQIPVFKNENDMSGLQFLEVVKRLPQYLDFSPSQGKISMQTCFVTMLHLANEQGLRFIQNTEDNNFLIYKDQIN